LLKFFLNPEAEAHLRGLEAEFGEGSNAIRLELNRFEQAGLLQSRTQGNRKLFKVNVANALFPELNSLVKKHLGIDQLVERVVTQLGHIDQVFLTGDYARGVDSGIIDIILIGSPDRAYLAQLISKAEEKIGRKVRSVVLTSQELDQFKGDLLLLWNNHG
jgi:hypothetical protein